nr:PREDICTED: zinc finger protein 831 [Macaca fascicularis]XP_015285506.1 PREDICTED: zinc finger protein 831 [Macaca fascicularis]
MEVPEPTCPAPPPRDQPAPTPGPPGAPGGQASPHLTLGPVLLPPEQGLAPTVFLKALPIPLYHTVPPGGLQPRAPLVTGSLDGGNVPFILSPVLQPEGPGPTQVGKPAAPTLTVNIVGTLPVLSPGLGPTLGSPGKVRNAGKYLCPHCGRDCLKPSVLEKHIRSHTGERPFPCATCGIAFKTQSNLYKHRRTQTHLNNSRLSSESEGGGGGLLEEGDKAGEPPRTDCRGESRSQEMHEGASERPLSPGAHVPLVAKNLDMKTEAAPCPGSAFADREAPWDSALTASTQPWRKLPEQKSPTVGKPCALQRQQATAAEKPWDAKAPEGRLRKCESTDSGYLSRSDSAEQPPAPCSPLHSLSEHSAESEGEGGPGPGPGGAGAEPGARGAGLELEKKRLEERIARLISHNQAVVDDAQLDNVRPRKTGLSKQGSIDLPTPYTYKDSFHFDIRALEPGRRRALGPARSTWTPPDKSRPLFFHSVPTQLSTTVECVPVTRSNSLPFVEGSRTWLEPRDPWPRTQKPLSPRPSPARLGCRSGLSSTDVPGGHPRALVRQAAVEDLPGIPTGDAPVPTEDTDVKRIAAREAAAGKGRAGGRKCGQRRLKMFSQEKWQVYGDETFKRIYQKMKASPHGGRKTREAGVGSGTELGLPLQKEAAGSSGAVPTQDRRTPVHEDTSTGATPEPWGNPPAPEASLVTEPTKHGEMVARTGDRNRPRVEEAVSSPALGGRDSPCSGSRSPLVSPNERLELGWQLTPAPGPLKGGDLEAPRPVLPVPKLEGGARGVGDVQETCPWAQTVLRWPSSGSGEDKLPSERKKLKVEDLHSWEQPEPVGAETPGRPVQAASLSSQKQDADPGEVPGGSKESARQGGELLESSGASLAADSVALKRVGPRDKAPPLHPAVPAPGEHPPLATPPQAPRVLSALADNAFSPKYLLRLPQAETPSPLPIPRGPRHSQDSLCSSGWPEERASFVGSALGTPLSPSPASGPSPGEADSILEDLNSSRPRDGRKGAQLRGDKGDRMATNRPAARESPISAPGAPREATSSPPTPMCEAHLVQDMEGDSDRIHRLCMGSTLATARPSGDVPNPWVPNWELGEPPENAPEDPSSGPLVGPDPCSRLQPGSFLTALTRPQGVSPGWPELALSSHSGTSRSHSPHSPHNPFPSLKAEPRLTWCCLSRSVPLPAEQKARAASVYLAAHFPGSSLRDEGPSGPPGSSGGWTWTSPGEGGLAQMSKFSYPTVPGVMSQHQASEPEGKKGLPRRAKMSHGNGKQRKLRTNPKRYKRNFLQSCVQLRASRLRTPTWVRRRSRHPPPLEGVKPCRTPGQTSSEIAGLNLQEEPSHATTESPPCCGKEEKKEGDCRQTSGTLSLGTSSRTVREMDKRTVKDISPSASEHSDCTAHSTAATSGFSLQSDTYLAVVNDALLPAGKSLDLGLLETQLPAFQDPVSTDPKPCIFSDAQGPSSFGSKGTFPRHDIATSVSAICISLPARTDHIAQEIHSAEPQDHSQTAGRTLIPSSPDSKATGEGRAQTLLPGRPSSGQRISDSVPLGSTEKTHLEIPASRPSSASSHQKEERHKTFFPSRGQYGCGEMAVPCPSLGSDGRKRQVSELITRKDSVVPSKPEQPIEIPEAPSKSLKKRSLEGMRKQTRVEFSDTSSDDEDRLVIEI